MRVKIHKDIEGSHLLESEKGFEDIFEDDTFGIKTIYTNDNGVKTYGLWAMSPDGKRIYLLFEKWELVRLFRDISGELLSDELDKTEGVK